MCPSITIQGASVSNKKHGINGIILAGGLSSRFGSCKSQLRVNEISLLEKNYSLLSKYCDTVLVSCKEGSIITNLPCLYDMADTHAPLFGIYTALEHFKSAVLVLSCDMPFVEDTTIQKLVHARNTFTANSNLCMTTFRQEETGLIETLVAIYEYKAKDFLETAIEKKQYALHKIFSQSMRYDIDVSNKQDFFNINYEVDLNKAQLLVKSRSTLDE